MFHQQVADPFAHVNIAAEQRVDIFVHGTVVEIQHRHALLARRRGRARRRRRLRQRFQRQSETQQ